LIDTHAHIHFPQFDEDREEIIKECEEKLTAVITVGCDLRDSVKAIEVAEKVFVSTKSAPASKYLRCTSATA